MLVVGYFGFRVVEYFGFDMETVTTSRVVIIYPIKWNTSAFV